MHALYRLLFTLLMLLAAAVPAMGQTRALLVACSDFVSQPDLGSEISGNLHMIGSALLGAEPALSGLSIEDGTIGNPEALSAAISGAFSEATQDDLSILYLCTHGVLSSDDGRVYLLLGNGETESPLSAGELYDMLSPLAGEKLLILDACFSGALLGRGAPDTPHQSESRTTLTPFESPFLADASIHVITSASAGESSWYYDSEGLHSGAVSYFASALSSGLGLYGKPEADISGDGVISLSELHRHLSVSVPSSSCQLLSSRPDALFLPAAQGAMLSRPLSDFSYGSSLLPADDPTLDFSFTVTHETAVQYRLIEFEHGSWNWAKAQTFLDSAETLSAGRHTRSLTLPSVKPEDGGYLMLQVFSVTDQAFVLCSERLIAVQPVLDAPRLTICAPDVFSSPGVSELPIAASLGEPAQITVTVYDEEGNLVRRLSSGELTRPSAGHVLRLYWDGRGAQGQIVPDGVYMLSAESFAGFRRVKAQTRVEIKSGG